MNKKRNRPNILFILADDMGYGDFGCFNYGLTETPVLNQLVNESVCFTQHYSASPVCAPARAALLTGRYPLRTGVIDTIALNYMHFMSPREITIGDIFRDAGYATGLIGKWHLGCVHKKYHPNSRGFNEFVGFSGGAWNYYEWPIDYNGTWKSTNGQYLTDLFTDEAIKFVRRHRNEPFFLHLAYNAPHTPLQAPEEDVKPFLENGRQNKGVSYVYGMIRRMDTGIGRILDELQKLNLVENTIVIFTSDNGPQFGCGDDQWRQDRFNCGFRGSKDYVYEGGIRVPLTIRWPSGFNNGRNFHKMVHFVDWLPTLCTAADIQIPKDLKIDGQNILPILRSKDGKINPKRFWQWSRQIPTITHNAAMRDGDWKLVRPGKDIACSHIGDWIKDVRLSKDVRRYPEKYQHGIPEGISSAGHIGVAPLKPQLFNIAADPLEEHDLAGNYPERTRRMLTELESWFKQQQADLSIARSCIFETLDDKKS